MTLFYQVCVEVEKYIKNRCKSRWECVCLIHNAFKDVACEECVPIIIFFLLLFTAQLTVGVLQGGQVHQE